MKTKAFITLALACSFMICLAAAIADASGKWKGTFIGPDGSPIGVTYNIKVDGDKLTGTALTPDGDVQIANGKTDGTTFSFSVTTGGMDIPHTGKFYGDSTGIDLEINGAKVHSVLKRPEEKK